MHRKPFGKVKHKKKSNLAASRNRVMRSENHRQASPETAMISPVSFGGIIHSLQFLLLVALSRMMAAYLHPDLKGPRVSSPAAEETRTAWKNISKVLLLPPVALKIFPARSYCTVGACAQWETKATEMPCRWRWKMGLYK